MNSQFNTILEGTLNYEMNQKVSVIFGIIIVLIMISLGVIRNIKKSKVNTIISISILILFCMAFCIYLIHFEKYKKNIQEDMNFNDYITYTGYFTHYNYQSDSFYHSVKIVDDFDNRILLRYSDYGNMYGLWENYEDFPLGTFYGTIIYSKRSKLILYWYVYE